MAQKKCEQKYLGHLQIPRLMKKHLKIFALPSALYLCISIILRANVNALFKICLAHTDTDKQSETTLKNQTDSCLF